MSTETKEEICHHRTRVTTEERGDLEVCMLCGQEKLIPPGKPPEVRKRGSLNGQVTAITPPSQRPFVETAKEVEPATEETLQEEESTPIDRSKPTDWDELIPQARGRWYNAHKEQILADIEEYGEKGALSMWGISMSAWRRIGERFGVHTLPDRKSKPVKPEKSKRDKYFIANKEQIITDYYRMELKAFLRHHQTSPVTWAKWRDKWNVMPKGILPAEWENLQAEKAAPEKEKPIRSGEAVVSVEITPFPSFDPSWNMLVQIEWIKIYPEVLKLKLPSTK